MTPKFKFFPLEYAASNILIQNNTMLTAKCLHQFGRNHDLRRADITPWASLPDKSQGTI